MAFSNYENESKENLLNYINSLEWLAFKYSNNDNTTGIIHHYVSRYPYKLDIKTKTELLHNLSNGIKNPYTFNKNDQPIATRHLPLKHRFLYCLKVLLKRV